LSGANLCIIMIMSKKEISKKIISTREQITMSQVELNKLKHYITSCSTPFSNIKLNTGVDIKTIKSTISRGWCESKVYEKIKSFVAELPEAPIVEPQTV